MASLLPRVLLVAVCVGRASSAGVDAHCKDSEQCSAGQREVTIDKGTNAEEVEARSLQSSLLQVKHEEVKHEKVKHHELQQTAKRANSTRNNKCENCPKGKWCSPVSGNYYDWHGEKDYYIKCGVPPYRSNKCESCLEGYWCSPISGSYYRDQAKPYYIQCGVATAGCCGNCPGQYCSTSSGKCYASKKKDYYAACPWTHGDSFVHEVRKMGYYLPCVTESYGGWSQYLDTVPTVQGDKEQQVLYGATISDCASACNHAYSSSDDVHEACTGFSYCVHGENRRCYIKQCQNNYSASHYGCLTSLEPAWRCSPKKRAEGCMWFAAGSNEIEGGWGSLKL